MLFLQAVGYGHLCYFVKIHHYLFKKHENKDSTIVLIKCAKSEESIKVLSFLERDVFESFVVSN